MIFNKRQKKNKFMKVKGKKNKKFMRKGQINCIRKFKLRRVVIIECKMRFRGFWL